MANGNAVIALDGAQLAGFCYLEVGKELDDGSFIPPKDLDQSVVGSMGNLENNRIEKNMKELMQLFVC